MYVLAAEPLALKFKLSPTQIELLLGEIETELLPVELITKHSEIIHPLASVITTQYVPLGILFRS